MLGRLLSIVSPSCDHVPASHAPPRAARCEECGSRFNLRICSTCGHVGCCDSQFAHARLHFHETGHPVMQAMTRIGTGFIWCYAHNAYVSDRHDSTRRRVVERS